MQRAGARCDPGQELVVQQGYIDGPLGACAVESIPAAQTPGLIILLFVGYGEVAI